MKNKRNIVSVAAIAAMAFAGHAMAQEQVVKIGQTGPLSGPNAFAGKDNENGVRLAIEELNAKKIMVGGKTLQFELVSEDDQGDPKAGVSVAQKFVDDGVKFVLGPYNSGVAIPASRVYSDGGILMSTVGTNPKVTQGGYKNLFRIVASDTQIGSAMAVYAAKELKVKKVGVIDDRTAFGQGIAEEFVKEAKKQGLTVVGHEFTTDKAIDFPPILTAPEGARRRRHLLRRLRAAGRADGAPDEAAGHERPSCSAATPCAAPRWASSAATRSTTTCSARRPARCSTRRPAARPSRPSTSSASTRDPDVYAASFYDQTMFIGQAHQEGQFGRPGQGAALTSTRPATRAWSAPTPTTTRAT